MCVGKTQCRPLPAGAWEKRLFDSLLFLQADNVHFVRVGSVIYEFGDSNFYPIDKVIANRLAIG
jgi:hypothetical protein